MNENEAAFLRDSEIARKTMLDAEAAQPDISTRKMSSIFKAKMKELGWSPSRGVAGATNYSKE